MADDAKPAASPYNERTLPPGVRSRLVEGVNGLSIHVLEAGHERPGAPAVLLIHGFPELAYSWRRVMPRLAAAGYHVIAPDQRGYGRTTGWDAAYAADPHPFRTLNSVRDAIGLVFALGLRSVEAVAGHDSGAPIAAWCALLRPDVFRRVAVMSAPFGGPPALPFDTAAGREAPARTEPTTAEIDAALAALDPPRKHYLRYYTTPPANDDMMTAPQGLRAFLRAYYHYKSAAWKGNRPFPLNGVSAEELAKMPTYYVMDLNETMAGTVAPHMPSAAEVAACDWLTESELDVYVVEYGRVGFQGGLQAYRRAINPANTADMQTYAGRTLDVPSVFISGASDWGVYQAAGALDAMRSTACTRLQGVHLVEGAGHWVQQEQPDATARLLLQLLQTRV